jgi:hypothetical protein
VEAHGWGSVGVFAQSAFSDGIEAHTDTQVGVYGVAGTLISRTRNGVGMYGTSTVNGGAGVRGHHDGSGIGVDGESSSGPGLLGFSSSGPGVHSETDNGIGVYGICRNPDPSLNRVGGLFVGGIKVINGIKPFIIDRPLDPKTNILCTPQSSPRR